MPTTIQTSGTDLHAFIAKRRRGSDRLYGVVDAARDKQLAFEGSVKYEWRIESLFEEGAAQRMRDVAPYVVPITFEPDYPFDESDYLDLWAKRIGGSNGILLLTPSAPGPLRNHLRKVFSAHDAEGESYYYRFYDPRVLRWSLPLYSGSEARQFFGPVSRIVVESETAGSMLTCEPAGDGARIIESPLREPVDKTESQGPPPIQDPKTVTFANLKSSGRYKRR